MKTRVQLHNELLTVLSKAYFQPPESLKLSYPCIVYSLEGDQISRADDLAYKRMKRYTVTVIDDNPDSEYSDELLNKFEYCSFDRCFVSNNLYHYTHTIYY